MHYAVDQFISIKKVLQESVAMMDDMDRLKQGLAPLPNFLLNLLSNQGFCGCVQSYNNTFAMATLGVTTGSNIVRASDYPYYVKLAGRHLSFASAICYLKLVHICDVVVDGTKFCIL